MKVVCVDRGKQKSLLTGNSGLSPTLLVPLADWHWGFLSATGRTACSTGPGFRRCTPGCDCRRRVWTYTKTPGVQTSSTLTN